MIQFYIHEGILNSYANIEKNAVDGVRDPSRTTLAQALMFCFQTADIFEPPVQLFS